MGEDTTFRVYEPDECGQDGYPLAWHESIKHAVREEAGHRCVRCQHPYRCGASPGEWSACDERCEHAGPVRYRHGDERWRESDTMEPGRQLLYDRTHTAVNPADGRVLAPIGIEARYRILTVHHLDGDKRNCRWWNLAALCQRCHLTIQGKVVMDHRWLHEHSDWFKPYVAGYYAHCYLGEDLTRAECEARLDELLALEHRQEALL